MLALLVEGGKTKTLVAVIDEKGEVKSTALSGSTGWSTVGFEKAFKNLVEVLNKAISPLKARGEHIEIAVMGLPDLDTKRVQRAFYNKLSSIGVLEKSRLIVIPDYVIAYYAVTLGKPGIAVIAGTGSIAYGRNSRGEEGRAGGWGWFGNDEGCSIWIAMKGLEAAFKGVDGRGPKTRIWDKVSEYFSVEDPYEIIEAIYSVAREDVGRLGAIAKLVDEAAREGDPIATSILELGGRELASMVFSVYNKIGIQGEHYIIGGVGSVFSSTILDRAFREEVKRLIENSIVVEPLVHYKPVKGLLAVLVDEGYVDESILDKALSNIEKRVEHST